MPSLHLFNPDHDYALGIGINVYVSPGKIKRIAKHFEMLPAYWAKDEDYILREDNTVCRMADRQDVELETVRRSIDRIEPWGWDHSLVMRLKALGFRENLLPDKNELLEMRRLSHRRISIDLTRHLDFEFIPEECTSLEQARNFLEREGYAFFKAPWSSSGRGIVNSRRMPEENLFAWIKGIINKQGSVIAEKGAEKKLDFATLWECSEGNIEFKGYSMTMADDKGQYLGNYCAPQPEMERHIRANASDSLDSIVERQSSFISNKLSNIYEGPLGIDMLIDKSGKIWPSIEINLRNTMGHASLAYMRNLEKTNGGVWQKDPYSIFSPL